MPSPLIFLVSFVEEYLRWPTSLVPTLLWPVEQNRQRIASFMSSLFDPYIIYPIAPLKMSSG